MRECGARAHCNTKAMMATMGICLEMGIGGNMTPEVPIAVAADSKRDLVARDGRNVKVVGGGWTKEFRF